MALLVAVARPAHGEHLARTQRAQAREQLLQAARFMQGFRAANDSFANDRSGAPVADALPTALRQSPAAGAPVYALDIPAANLTSVHFELRMEPLLSGAMSGDECGSFMLTSDGRRGVRVRGRPGDPALVRACWE